MTRSFRRSLLGILAVVAMFTFSGCAENERREVRVEQEQQESQPVEEGRGQEMIVE